MWEFIFVASILLHPFKSFRFRKEIGLGSKITRDTGTEIVESFKEG